MDRIVTIEDLAKAIIRNFNFDRKTAKKTAEYLMNFFGFSGIIQDSHLKTEDRNVFYDFEEKGIIKTDMYEVILPEGSSKHGAEYRVFFWILNNNKIFEEKKSEETKDPYEQLYKGLSEDAWHRSNNSSAQN